MATSEGIPSSIDIEFLELNDNPYLLHATMLMPFVVTISQEWMAYKGMNGQLVQYCVRMPVTSQHWQRIPLC